MTRRILRVTLTLALAIVLMPSAHAGDGWFGWLPGWKKTKKEEDVELPLAGSARSSTKDGKLPSFMRGLNKQTKSLFEPLGFSKKKKSTPRPVSGETRRIKSARPKSEERPWWKFWGEEEKPKESGSYTEWLKQDRPKLEY